MMSLTLRDARKSRELLKSMWFTKYFGKVNFKYDQDTKGSFENSDHGVRNSTSLSSSVMDSERRSALL